MTDYRKYWDEEIETMPCVKLETLENTRLKEQLGYVYAKSPFYRKKFGEAGVNPAKMTSVRELPRLPFTTKDELRETQAEIGRMSHNLNRGPNLEIRKDWDGKPCS